MKHSKVSLSLIFLGEIFPLSQGFIKYYKSKVSYANFKKGTVLVKQGGFSDKIYFIRQGLIRGFYQTINKEFTTWISMENELVTSITGFFVEQPTRENIQVLEDTYVEYISINDLNYLLENFPEMSRIYLKLLTEYYMHSESRALMARLPNAKLRYDFFIEAGLGHLVERVPHKYLASLLGIRPETFSRLLRDYSS
ncbi:Crp/Fnr family transcriptional regulator [Galbibacter sp. PAP.153]|uniref:Crp/Fnr family transcriptional regulator n=1 Tax=Galbibacter sp. PAP.153 TaxID=3104623 RepID=UPI00300AA287